MSQDVHQLIMDEIGKIPGDKKFAGESVMVCCPLPEHNDNSPSCGIYTAVGMEIPLGQWHCFGCGEKGGWNDLAKRSGLTEIEGWKLKDAGANSTSALGSMLDKSDKKILSYKSVENLMKALHRHSYIQWPTDLEWRSFPGQLVLDAGGILNCQRTGSNVCFFPCTSGRRYIGGIAAYMQRQVTGTSYVNSQGDWAKKKGLFPLALVKKCIAKYKLRYVILVEGPRDALALLSIGIPALAVLGAEQFSREKRLIVESLGVSHVFSMTDNDKGGALARKRIKDEFSASDCMIKFNSFKLPVEYDKKGKLIKMDPENAPRSIMKEIKCILREKFKRPFIPAKKLGWNRVQK